MQARLILKNINGTEHLQIVVACGKLNFALHMGLGLGADLASM